MTRVLGEVRVAGDPPGRFDAVDAGHPDVHQDDVGPVPPDRGDRVEPVGRLAGQPEVVLALDQGAQAEADQILVVGDEDRDHDGIAGPTGRPGWWPAPRTRRPDGGRR